MATSIEQTNGQQFSENASSSLSDADWLMRLRFRNSVAPELKSAAALGDGDAFSKSLNVQLLESIPTKKGERKFILARLKSLQDVPSDSEELVTALFHNDLKKAERSAHLEAFIAENVEEIPESQTLCDALWVLTVYRGKLTSDAMFSLWRWALQRGQAWMEARPVCDPEQGLSQLRYLEICYLMAAAFPELQGSSQLLKETTSLIRSCLDESTDTDGTPQPEWIPGLVDSLSILARLTLFANLTSLKLWNKEYRLRVEGILSRAATFAVGKHFSFSTPDEVLDYGQLTTIAQLLAGEDSGVAQLWGSVHDKKSLSARKISDWSLPDEVHQSDWAMLGCLRSAWKSSLDHCVVLYDSNVPQVDIVTAGSSLFQGSWSHKLKVDGRVIECSEGWTCTCWFADEEVNFIELMQEVDAGTKIYRQIILRRDQQQLLLNHAVHAVDSQKIEYQSRLPLSGNWIAEQDTTTREAALISNSKRVRVYPISCEQERVNKAEGKIAVEQNSFLVDQRSTGDALFISTVFDWSQERMKKGVDWSRLAVAQDGKLESLNQAAAFRCRVGRDQWLLYHSLKRPEIPRTVMGLHTPHETVLSQLTPEGEIEPIVEVEM